MSEPTIRLRLDIAYDGTNFRGWAKQPGLRTVQGEAEVGIATLIGARVDPPQLVVGGRTDAGVHARGQVAHLDVTPAQLDRWDRQSNGDESPELLRARRLTGIMKQNAPDAVVHRVRVVPGDFDARFSALSRRYEYRLQQAGAPVDPLVRGFTVTTDRPVDLGRLQAASASLLGLRDFTAFCQAREGATAVRTLEEFSWRITDDGAFAARIAADAFCHSMVRSLVGAVVAVGSGKMELTDLAEVLASRRRTGRFVVMPAHGLSLEEIGYPADEDLAARAELTRARRAPLPECGEAGVAAFVADPNDE